MGNCSFARARMLYTPFPLPPYSPSPLAFPENVCGGWEGGPRDGCYVPIFLRAGKNAGQKKYRAKKVLRSLVTSGKKKLKVWGQNVGRFRWALFIGWGRE